MNLRRLSGALGPLFRRFQAQIVIWALCTRFVRLIYGLRTQFSRLGGYFEQLLIQASNAGIGALEIQHSSRS